MKFNNVLPGHPKFLYVVQLLYITAEHNRFLLRACFMEQAKNYKGEHGTLMTF
jgi:hypothetical protein